MSKLYIVTEANSVLPTFLIGHQYRLRSSLPTSGIHVLADNRRDVVVQSFAGHDDVGRFRVTARLPTTLLCASLSSAHALPHF